MRIFLVVVIEGLIVECWNWNWFSVYFIAHLQKNLLRLEKLYTLRLGGNGKPGWYTLQTQIV